MTNIVTLPQPGDRVRVARWGPAASFREVERVIVKSGPKGLIVWFTDRSSAQVGVNTPWEKE